MTKRSSSPPSSTDRERIQALMERRISRLLSKCVDNLMVLANGVEVQPPEDDCEGGQPPKPAYHRPPDRAANEYIINRILGRPPSRKPLADPEQVVQQRVDLSRIPQDRLDLMEKWLIESDNQPEE